MKKDTVVGFNFITPTFTPVSGGKVNIQDIQIANGTEWGDNIQILDEGGAITKSYIFDGNGWLDDETFTSADVTIEPGQGILIDTVDIANITFAGNVPTTDTVVETVIGFNFIGNNTPTAINIQDIQIANGTEWGDNIQILDEGGAITKSYIFDGNGWLDDETFTSADVTIEPGQGILIDTVDVATVTIPGVTIE